MRRAGQLVQRAQTVCQRRLQSTVAPQLLEVTEMPNKIRVVTESRPGHFSSLGLFVEAGSRYEVPDNVGAGHFIDRMAFKSTTSRSEEDMALAMVSLGGQIMCSASRESMMYQSSHFHSATPTAMSLIADTVLNPNFLEEELEREKDSARYEIREISAKADMILPEVLHSVAYNNHKLGNPLLCPSERVDSINAQLLRGTLQSWYRPERMVVAGAGMPHQELVELTDKFFSSLKSEPTLQPSRSPSLLSNLTTKASSLLGIAPTGGKSIYTGGHKFIHQAKAELNHIYIGFEGIGIHDEDVYTLAVIQVLLGGGGSFSAGGPGKGMYSRLYTKILNQFHQVEHCQSYHHIYADSSLFGLWASYFADGTQPEKLMPHLVFQFSSLLYTPLPENELQRAKNQLKSSLMMALESRAIEVEDLGRQFLTHNRKVPVSEMVDIIDKVTPEKIQQVAQRVFGTKAGQTPTVVAMGTVDVGDYAPVFKKYGVGAKF